MIRRRHRGSLSGFIFMAACAAVGAVLKSHASAPPPQSHTEHSMPGKTSAEKPLAREDGRSNAYRADAPASLAKPSTQAKKGARSAAPGQGLVRVTQAVDGDTLRLSNGEKVRLLGVDTPETHHPTKPVQFYGPEAAAYTKREIEGREATLKYGSEFRDKYGRILAYVYRNPDDFFLNEALVKLGYARVYRGANCSFKKLFLEHEREAVAAKLGMWQKTPPP